MQNKELTKYREDLINQLRTVSDGFCEACRKVADPHRKLETSGWTVHQLASHTRDVQKYVYGMRIRKTLSEDAPFFPNFDADEWMAKHYRHDEPLESILGEFQADMNELLAILPGLPVKAWSRLSRHETQGERSLQAWVERCLAHIQEHWSSVKQA